MRAHLDTLEALLACTTPEELRRAVGEYVKRLGFDSWVYAANPNGQNCVSVCAERVSGRMARALHREGLFGIDPVVAHCRDHVTPLVWNADGPLGESQSPFPSFFHDAADFGLKTGISAPVHGLGCQWGLLSVAGSDDKTDRRTQLSSSPACSCSRRSRTRSVTASRPRAQTGGNVHLTARELECLRWAAEGKTGWEIGRLLGISERTVVFHVENAARKLGVFGRRQAVARAIALQLITL